MSDSNPLIGEKTPSYPFGYGFCQCGCHHITKLNPDGVWASYVEGHEPNRQLPDADTGQASKSTEEFDSQFAEYETAQGIASLSSSASASPLSDTQEGSVGLQRESTGSNLKSEKLSAGKGVRTIDPVTLKAGERLPRVTIKEPPPTPRPKSFLAPDQPLLELYMDLVQKHEILELQMKAVRLDLENTISLIQNLWRDSTTEKQLVVEKLRGVLNVLKTPR
jgi:hypothetical protein